MRWFLGFLLVVILPSLGGADGPAKSAVTPIKVVTLNRTDPVLYEKDTEPIFISKCFVCHSGSVKEGKFDLGSYEGLMKGGKRGQPIVAGKAAESLLVQLAGKTSKPTMPPKGEVPLTPEEL